MRSSWRALRTALLAFGFAVWAAAIAVAQDPAQETFQPVAPGDLALERLPATPFVFWAYALVWLLLIAYVFFLWRRIGRLEQELAALTSRLHPPSS